MQRLTSLRVALWVCAASALARDVTAGEVFRRATVLEDRVGRVEIRRAYGARITLPKECPDCSGVQVYDEVLEVDFLAERRDVQNDIVDKTETALGTIRLAISFSDTDLEEYEDELEAALGNLSADAFVQPFAGTLSKKPFDDASLAARSELPTWICSESEHASSILRLGRIVEQGPEGPIVMGTSGASFETVSTPLCEEMAAAVEGRAPLVLETLPTPRRLREWTVEQEDVVRIDPQDVAAVAKRPDGARLYKRTMEEGVSGSAKGSLGDGRIVHAQQGAEGWRFDAYAEAARIPIETLERAAWLQRWTTRLVERQLGPRPQERVVEEKTFLVAYLATVPAALVETRPDDTAGAFFESPAPEPTAAAVGPAEPPAIDRSELVAWVAEHLDLHSGPPTDLLELLLTKPEAGLESEAWIAVVCRDDGTADYCLPPTAACQRVTNADLFCTALESRL